MGSAVYERERRSSRLFKRVRVLVIGKDKTGRRFREPCETVIVSAHGALLCVPRPLELDAMLTLTNPFTSEEQECRVAYLGDESGKGQRVGVEFLTPAPHFWGIEFSPSDGAPPAQQN
jgi:PilZ domain